MIREPRDHHVADRSSTQIMNEDLSEDGFLARRSCSLEVTDLVGVEMEDVGAVETASSPRSFHNIEQLARERKHATVLVLADFRSQANDTPGEVYVSPLRRLHFP